MIPFFSSEITRLTWRNKELEEKLSLLQPEQEKRVLQDGTAQTEQVKIWII